MQPQEKAKLLAAKEALKYVNDKMIIGLGSGSTCNIFINKLGEKIKKENLDIVCVASSVSSENLARQNSIEIVDINQVSKIDAAIDGADEIDEMLNLVKGGGGALTREKIIDYFADGFIVIVDESKLVKILGKFPIAVEVLPFSYKQTEKILKKYGETNTRMKNNEPFVTDNKNYIIDVFIKNISFPKETELQLNNIPGVVENGLFTRKPNAVIVGCSSGSACSVRIIK